MPKRYWARLRADVDFPLRRGAWYRVKKLSLLDAIVDVAGEPVRVPRSALDIRSAAPREWSVVPGPKNPDRFPGVTKYAVCPNCRERVPLKERPASLRCGRCHQLSQVAWDESYFLGA